MKLTRQLLSVGLALFCSAALASAIPGRAEVKKVTGTATVAKGTGAATSLVAGMVLGTGDTISTSAGSTVDLFLGLNGDVLRVDPDSTLSLDQLDITRISPPLVNTKLNVTKGGVTANVITKLAAASRYEVRTPSGVAGIRGTVYNASVGTGMSVLHGTVSWTPTGGVVVNLSMGQTANLSSVPSAIGAAIASQMTAGVTQSTQAVVPGQLANTINTLAQSVATSAALAVIAGGGTQVQAAAAAASAAQQVTTQATAALTAGGFTAAANIVGNGAAQTAVAAAAIGAATAVAATGGTVAQAQAAGLSAATTAATATGGTVTAAITLVSTTAATTTVAAVASGLSATAAASATVTTSSATTTATVTTSAGTGTGVVEVAPAVIINPLTVSGS